MKAQFNMAESSILPYVLVGTVVAVAVVVISIIRRKRQGFQMENEKKDFCPVCNKLMRTHTYSDLTDCMEKLFDMIQLNIKI